MSHSMKNNSQVSSHKIEFDLEDPALHNQLARIFTKMVSDKFSTLLQASQEVKQEDLAKNAATTSDSVTKVTGPENFVAAPKSTYKGKSTVVGQLFDVTFEVPEDCISAQIDMDSIAEINPNCQSSFAERLKGWHIERRQRLMNKPVPRIDWSFRHSNSRRELRSIVEVVDYILYEVYPRNPNKDHLMILKEDVIEEMLGVNPKGESSSVCEKRQKAQRHKEFVEKFLRESWLNLMNTKVTEGDNKQEKLENFSYADHADDESVESETGEEMIEAFYNEMQEKNEEILYVDCDDDDDDESIYSETDEEMIEGQW
ncbi:hypothetical protein L6164_008510 [Bauhinia variegata]|uniref:Uncharacterized protein n=1 Tax=Bauhinia variegata TaxID=167791 RepID=A0ACB9PH00_BAUVA|nr:hypothetical protein L6164_008510 [Bauhinia variegata]